MSPASQMEMFGSQDMGTPQEANDCLRNNLQYANRRLTKAIVEFRKLRTELQAVRSERDDFRKKLIAAERECSLWMTRAFIAESRVPRKRGELDTLKALLVQCHPDRWSAGQPATALAHEMFVQLNALRQCLEEVQP